MLAHCSSVFFFRNDCGGIHIFASMNRYPFTDSATDPDLLWNPVDQSGRLANYLLDPRNAFTDPVTKGLTKLMLNLTDAELASKRFKEDISVLNFFFDTPIITRITLEMRITIFDQISAVGGTLGLFTGVSLITFAELTFWGLKFVWALARRAGRTTVQPRTGSGGSRSRNITVANSFGSVKANSDDPLGTLNLTPPNKDLFKSTFSPYSTQF